ncbi:hypothetical protein WJX73_004187 [Symbiochloris irregularis]|uniref:DNA mismatch repair proteins mutS family domain-containing protein n=1 Tax=Symbiochloris irregularis TaxID=706552 RepID=A0AAW1NZ88_9CHLO
MYGKTKAKPFERALHTARSESDARQDIQEYWRAELDKVDSPSAKPLLPHIDVTQPLGITYGQKPILHSFFQELKQQHPTMMLLVRIGEFYEAMGIDAVMCVQHAKLNPMPVSGGRSPRAGCPIMNLRRTLRDLTSAGFSVVICEEAASPYAYGAKTAKKERYLAGVVTPASPNYLHGLMDDEGAAQVDLEPTPPLLAIVQTKNGYTVVEVHLVDRRCKVFYNQTEDSVLGRIQAGGLVPPLYMHSTTEAVAAAGKAEGQAHAVWREHMATNFRNQVGSVTTFASRLHGGSGSERIIEGLLDQIKRDTGMPEDTSFQVAVDKGLQGLPFATMSQLGLGTLTGVPSLLDALAAPTTATQARRWLRRQLLSPPPLGVKLAIREACRLLIGSQEALPTMLLLHDLGVAVDHAGVLASCREVDQTIAATVAEACGASADPDHKEGIQAVVASVQKGSSCPFPAAEAGCLEEMFSSVEKFHGKVLNGLVADELDQVADARSQVAHASVAAFKAIYEEVPARSRSQQPKLIFDSTNQAVWIKPGKAVGTAAAQRMKFINPLNRHGKKEAQVYSTVTLEGALDQYRSSCLAASRAVRAVLQELAVKCEVHTQELMGASNLSVIMTALLAHVQKAHFQRCWTLPQYAGEPLAPAQAPALGPTSTPAPASTTGGPASAHAPAAQQGTQAAPAHAPSPAQGDRLRLQVHEMWPYWMDPKRDSTVRNSLDTNSIILLTGPNMAGKSTVLRSTAAVALCAMCGLLVPAKSAQVPEFQRVELRTFVGDNPLENMSAFAVEMTEMRQVLQSATHQSLVLIDELGKGTEAGAGASLSASMLEELDKQRCLGIFATHLHHLLDLPLEAPSMEHMQMEVQPCSSSDPALPGERLQPTWRMVPGKSTTSLAMEVASDCGIPVSTVARARSFMQMILNNASAPVLSADQAPPKTLAAASSPAQQHVGWQVLKAEFVDHGQQPPPSVALSSCVYLLELQDGWMYCGQTDDLLGRLDWHRGHLKVHGNLQAAYVRLPDECRGQSTARSVESDAIRSLRLRGAPLLSTHDERSPLRAKSV